jgi:hypothetical protein
VPGSDAFFNPKNVADPLADRGDLQSLPAGIRNGAAVQVWGLVFYSQLPQGSSIKATRGRAVRFLVRQQNEPAFIMVAGRIGAN